MQWFVLQQTQQNQAQNQITPNTTLISGSELIYNLSMVLFQLLQTVLLGEKSYVRSPMIILECDNDMKFL